MLASSGGVANRSLSRSVQRRILRREAIRKRVNLAISALNSMFSGGNKTYAVEAVRDLRGLPQVQRDAILHIVCNVKRCGVAPAGACYSGAIDALRVSCGSYQDDSVGVGDTVSMELGILSLPSLETSGVNLESELRGEAGAALRNYEGEMLQDAPNWGRLGNTVSNFKPYNDPQIWQQKFYLQFLRRLHQSGVLTFCSRPRGRVGAFAVSKKPKVVNGAEVRRQRLILDCRQVNLQFRAPPITELGSLASLCELELGENEVLYTGGADIQDCFYACYLPRPLVEFFCLYGDVRVGDVGAILGGSLPDAVRDLPANQMVSPCLSVLPMGFSWSFYLVQQLHEQITLASLHISRHDLFLDARPPPTIEEGKCAGMPYCDNVHVMSNRVEVAEEGRLKVCKSLRESGFKVHEEQPAAAIVQTLGGIIDGESGLITVTPTRLWNLILAFEYCGKTGKNISSDLVRRLLGHAMFVCVLCRAGMSVFRSLYDYANQNITTGKLWKSGQRECLTFAGILPLMCGNLRRAWSTRLTCSDASPDGFGVVERDVETWQVRELGRWNERWRYKRLPVSEWRPRDRALGVNPMVDVESARRPEGIEEQSHFYSENEDFEEVPFALMNPKSWRTSKIGLWPPHKGFRAAREAGMHARRQPGTVNGNQQR